MCGIAGIYLTEAARPDEEELRAMSEAMRYRGPDDHGYFLAPHIGLVHRRLSIRDLSSNGHCPMGSSDGRVQVVFNGEIYNWRELRKDLEIQGFHFASKSDTEVILHGYAAWGDAVVPKLRGMFAIAIWDAHCRRLLLARDRFGEKPLYYQNTTVGLAFASSLGALNSRRPGGALNDTAVACHLVHNFIPSTHVVWDGFLALPQATMLVTQVDGTQSLTRYWDFPRQRPLRKRARQCEDEVLRALEDSVVRCLDADVPTGVFLSGGVDSSLVAALAARHQPGIKSFSLGFTEEDHNELPHARRVAKHLQLDNHEVLIDAADVIECLPHLVREYGQPFGDSSAIATHLLAKLARKHVKVCLAGDGADESFGGYWRMQSAVYAARYASAVPRCVRESFVPGIANALGRHGQRWMALNRLSLAKPGSGYTNSLSWFDSLAEIAGPRLQGTIAQNLASLRVGRAIDWREASTIQKNLYDDFQIQLPDDFLVKVDVASMAASLEVRAPYLDHQLVELAWLLPDSMKLRWGVRKWLLKRLAARLVPPEVVYRPKMGFALPLEHWFRGDLGLVLDRLMDDSVAAKDGWIQKDAVLARIRMHAAGIDQSSRLWSMLWLEVWLRLFSGTESSSGIDLAELAGFRKA